MGRPVRKVAEQEGELIDVSTGVATPATLVDPEMTFLQRMVAESMKAGNMEMAQQALSMLERREAKAEDEAVKLDQSRFYKAISLAEADMEGIRKDKFNTQTRSNYATYAALDKAIRPIYTKHRISIMYDQADCPIENHVRVIAYVTHTSEDGRFFQKVFHRDVPADGKGAKGNDVMTKTHATKSAFTYAKRMLLEDIFALAETDEQHSSDDDGNAAGDTGPISKDQAAEINKLCELIDNGKQRLMEHLRLQFSVEWQEIEEISAGKYDYAVNVLNKQKKKDDA